MGIYHNTRFSLRVIVCLLVAVGILWISPEHLYSQAQGVLIAQTGPIDIKSASPTQAQREAKANEEKAKEVLKTPAQLLQEEAFDPFKRPTVTTQAVVLVLLSLMPFIVMILTSFLKIVVVLSLLRSALGVQQAPPNQVINGVAFMLSLYVMYPTALKMYDAAQSEINKSTPQELFSKESASYFMEIANAAKEPLREFLKKNSSIKHQGLFYRMAYRVLPENYRATLKPDDLIILIPGYITSQLKDAFEIGVLIYIPFFVIDLVTSNILLAMGMMMLSPVTISMPLKLFLLVMLDGWTLLIEGLVSTFR